MVARGGKGGDGRVEVGGVLGTGGVREAGTLSSSLISSAGSWGSNVHALSPPAPPSPPFLPAAAAERVIFQGTKERRPGWRHIPTCSSSSVRPPDLFSLCVVDIRRVGACGASNTTRIISRCLGLSPAPAPRLEQATRVAGLTISVQNNILRDGGRQPRRAPGQGWRWKGWDVGTRARATAHRDAACRLVQGGGGRGTRRWRDGGTKTKTMTCTRLRHLPCTCTPTPAGEAARRRCQPE